MRARHMLPVTVGELLVPWTARADLGEQVATALKSGSGFAYILVFFGGVLTSLTPCVYPLIPITLSIFGARGEAVGRGRAMTLAAAYVGGIGLMYTMLGVFFALAGRAFGTFMASPWFMVPIALLFLAMAASMFGAFEMKLPASLHERLNRVGGASYPGAFAMGLVGGIIAAPCTGPVLASILAYVATTRSVAFGGSLLFTYALGMGMLFFVLAATAASLPKSGAWMDSVKSLFGVVMVVAALYFLRNVVGPLAQYGEHHAGWTSGFAALHGGILLFGLVLGGIHLSWHSRAAVRARKALGIALIVFGSFGVITWAMTPAPSHFAWVRGEQAGLAAARAQHKPAVIDFAAEWCNPCKQMEISVFGNAEVQRELAQRFVPIKIDVTEDTDENTALKERWSASTLPTIVLLDRDGKTAHRFNREIEAEELLTELKKVE